MNNDLFKKYIYAPTMTIVDKMGGIEVVRDLHTQMPEQTVHFIAGALFHWALQSTHIHNLGIPSTPWRDEKDRKPGPIVLTREEIRRTLDYVRLLLETESTTS